MTISLSPTFFWALREELLNYIKQDVLVLGGIMQKTQTLCWEAYVVDIENVFTISSLALTIFRKKDYSEENRLTEIQILSYVRDTSGGSLTYIFPRERTCTTMMLTVCSLLS